MSAIQSNKSCSAKLVGLVDRHFDALATAMEVWQELADEEPVERKACADYWHTRSERLLAVAERRAQAEGVSVWDALS